MKKYFVQKNFLKRNFYDVRFYFPTTLIIIYGCPDNEGSTLLEMFLRLPSDETFKKKNAGSSYQCYSPNVQKVREASIWPLH